MKPLSRRTLLRGFGTALALPALEAMLPSSARAQQAGPPQRFVAFFVPNGVNLTQWRPTGATPATSPLLAGPALTPLHHRLTVVSNVSNVLSDPRDDGAHHRATAGALTCSTATGGDRVKLCDALSAPGPNPSAAEWEAAFDACAPQGMSIDQVLARSLPRATTWRSLEYGPGYFSNAGGGQHYSASYLDHVSWLDAQTPLSRRPDPATALQALVASGPASERDAARAQRLRRGQSVIDAVRADALALEARLGRDDRRRVDAWLTGLRELEERTNAPQRACSGNSTLTGRYDVVRELGTWARDFIEVMVLALRCDLSRVVTFMLGGGGGSASALYPGLFASEAWALPSGGAYPIAQLTFHELSHWRGLTEGGVALPSAADQVRATEHKYRAYALANAFHLALFAELLTRLEQATEVDGSPLLEHCCCLFLSELSDGNSHSMTELPVLLAGGAGVGLGGNRVVDGRNAPLANLYLALARRFGVPLTRFGAAGVTPMEGVFMQ